MKMYSILQRLRFHIISDNSIENLVTHTPGKFLLKCDLNSSCCPVCFLLLSFLQQWRAAGYHFLCKSSSRTSDQHSSLTLACAQCRKHIQVIGYHQKNFVLGSCHHDVATTKTERRAFAFLTKHQATIPKKKKKNYLLVLGSSQEFG